MRARLEELAKVESIIDQLYTEGVLSDALYGNVMVVATEATLNAINHGSAQDEQKAIAFSIELDEKEVVVQVSDSGRGFYFNNLPDPTDPENIEKGSGRGIFIMKNLSDDLEFLNEGATVRITFERESTVTVGA